MAGECVVWLYNRKGRVQMKQQNISWSKFEVCNQSHQTDFEKMCRQLFNYHFFGNNAIFISSPNNPGIEIEPILDSNSNKRISFQAKYFSNKTDYMQIKKSAEKAVKYYSGKLDVIYLYCNKDLTVTSKQYENILAILNAANIDLIPINNQSILEQAMQIPTITSLYFNEYTLKKDWFNEHFDISLNALGQKYNRQFNVDTATSEYLDLFSRNEYAIKRINQKKSNAILRIKERSWVYTNDEDFISKACDAIEKLLDITPYSISECLVWKKNIEQALSKELNGIKTEINIRRSVLDKTTEEERADIIFEIEMLQELANFTSELEFEEVEKNLIEKKTLVISGEWGTGKSQLFANAIEKTLKSCRQGLLLLGHTYLSDNNIESQTLSNLGLSLDFDTLLGILEGTGEQKNECVVIYIDAINETTNKEIWKVGLASLVSKVNKLNHVRLAISVRTGYEPLVFDDALQRQIESKEIIKLSHTGFQENSMEAIQTFLNHYNITFSPTYLLQHEMANPLFLTLFCENYTGEDFDIFSLFEKVIKKADTEAQKAIGLDGTSDILKYLIHEIVELKFHQNDKSINKQELLTLEFWNTYGLSDKKMPFISALEKAGILVSWIYEGVESYSFAYNMFEDFLHAKFILEKYIEKESLKNYLRQELLKIEDGKIKNYSNKDVFIAVCDLYAKKYNEECIDIIDYINDGIDKDQIAEDYVRAFIWRESKAIDKDAFLNFLSKYEVSIDAVWRVFIGSSTKSGHPLNADTLHSVLLNKSISKRDSLWTIYVNGLDGDDERIFQLIDIFDKENSLSEMKIDNTKLLLILFSWLLTSSNRILRDKVSKAMIEILKKNFQMCKVLLELFNEVNDPYVIQRLYGVVFGACMKRTSEVKDEFRELAKYTCVEIFSKETVYPDVLLRDYARLIVERWLYEYPNDKSIVDVEKIWPPYKSHAIPVVTEESYYQESLLNSGFHEIAMSMLPQIESPGGYGDFGRYIFQAALSDFKNIDMSNLYHYAMQFIRDDLGYDDKLFGLCDTFGHYFDRQQTKKKERIGKKYQWIAMYNILARISDSHPYRKQHETTDDWRFYVRDFDPTLNCNFFEAPDIPQFELRKEQYGEFLATQTENENEIKEWTETAGLFFGNHASELMLTDTRDQKWVILYQFKSEKIEHYKNPVIWFKKGMQELWSISTGYLVKKAEFKNFKKELGKLNFMGRWFPEGYDIDNLFNREYAWSSDYNNFYGESWLDCEVKTGEKITTKHKGLLPKFKTIENGDPNDINEVIFFEEGEWEQTEEVKRVVGEVMPIYSHISCGMQYDASQAEEKTAFYVPCKDVVDCLQLEQKDCDGYFYDKNNELVAFDGNLTNTCDGLLIKKEHLEKYLEKQGLRLFWTCVGEKQYFGNRSVWSGLCYLEGDDVMGKMEIQVED